LGFGDFLDYSNFSLMIYKNIYIPALVSDGTHVALFRLIQILHQGETMAGEKFTTDILIIGMGAAGQLAALYAYDANPNLNITIVTKALKGKGGCSRMVQGGLNVVLNEEDSHEKHLMDTLKGGQYINNQDLAKTLVEEATPTIKEMETRFGCFFDRNPDGTIHQKPFAGQSFDRTVHKGDLTGIEMISRTTEQVMKRDIKVLEECRAVDLLTDSAGKEVTGALLLDMRRGSFIVAEASATLVATGGGPTQYRFHAPGPEKSVDGLGMMYRAGVVMRDMEMIQFHPTGLIIPGSVVAGSLLEEGLRGSGAYLYNGQGERYMKKYAPDVAERATRDVVSRSSFLEMLAGRECEEGGVRIDAAHLGSEFVLKNFPGMCNRCRQFGYDLSREPVPVSPTAHFVMGGANIDKDCHTSMERLFVAGEDAGGVHGGNRLGGNGICESTVYGRQAGKSLARYLANNKSQPIDTAKGMVAELIKKHTRPFEKLNGENAFELRAELKECNWIKVGVVRNADDMEEAVREIAALRKTAADISLTGARPYNMLWNTYIDFMNMLDVSDMVAASALARRESRAAHYRSDFPEQNDEIGLFNNFMTRGVDGLPEISIRPVEFKYKTAEECRNYKK
jgi:succinate dehydrogenase/fumarate reductase flavoprotein subunit